MKPLDALVIGAGPAGATCAALLARAGWSVAIAEKSPFPRDKVCGGFIGAPTYAVLHRLEAYESFLCMAGPEVREVGFLVGSRRFRAEMPAFGRAVRRDRFDALLLDNAARAGAMVFQPFHVVKIERDEQQFLCSAQSGNAAYEFRARTVIAAHGSWLSGPLATQARKSSDDADLIGFKAQFSGAALPPRYMPLVAFSGGYGGLVRADEGLTSFSLCIRRDALTRCRERYAGVAAGEAVLAYVFAQCPAARDVLGAARCEGSWLAAGPIRPGIRRFERDGVLVIGNAAAEAHPAIAEGIGMAMRSAEMLADALIARDVATLEQRWRSRFSRHLLASRAIAAMAMHPAASRSAAALLTMAPALLGPCARLSGKAAAL